jgi:rhodanese-related sulfurtransferase
MTPFIQNVSAEAVREGVHFDCGDNAMLIQITDPGNASFFSTDGFPKPAHKFKEVRQFQFFDCDNADHPVYGEFTITDSQALAIVAALDLAKSQNMNVVVHCHAGICRSGAVAEVASLMGFNLLRGVRIPNVLVKKKMMQVLGLSYDENAELKARYDQMEKDKLEGKIYY